MIENMNKIPNLENIEVYFLCFRNVKNDHVKDYWETGFRWLSEWKYFSSNSLFFLQGLFLFFSSHTKKLLNYLVKNNSNLSWKCLISSPLIPKKMTNYINTFQWDQHITTALKIKLVLVNWSLQHQCTQSNYLIQWPSPLDENNLELWNVEFWQLKNFFCKNFTNRTIFCLVKRVH